MYKNAALPPPVVLDDDGARLDDSPETLTAQEIDAALTRERDVFLASCRDFNDSPFGLRGKPCPVALWGCFECTNAVFTTRHLPQVLTFLDFLERQREWSTTWPTSRSSMPISSAPSCTGTCCAEPEAGRANVLPRHSRP